MSIEENVQVVKNFLAALGSRNKQGLLALSAEDIEWITPGEFGADRHVPRARGSGEFTSEG